MKKFLFVLLLPFCLQAQDDLLSEIDTDSTEVQVTSAFKSLKIVNLESKLVSSSE